MSDLISWSEIYRIAMDFACDNERFIGYADGNCDIADSGEWTKVIYVYENPSKALVVNDYVVSGTVRKENEVITINGELEVYRVEECLDIDGEIMLRAYVCEV